eukprot:gene9707-11921_t
MVDTVFKYFSNLLSYGFLVLFLIFQIIVIRYTIKETFHNEQKPFKNILEEWEENKDSFTNFTQFKETTVFLGNSNAGQSTIFNVFPGRVQSESGISMGGGLTQFSVEFLSKDGKRYIDTPSLADPLIRAHAAKNIEAALKKETNYKIVFVVTLPDGRMKKEDIETINSIIESVSMKFKYSIIFNKIGENVAKQMDLSNNLKLGLSQLKRKPISTFVVPFIKELNGSKNKLVQDPVIRKSIVQFVERMEANLIMEKQVSPIDFDEKVEQIQNHFSKLLEESNQKRIQAETQIKEEQNKRKIAEARTEEALKQRVEEEKKRMEKELELSKSIKEIEIETKSEVSESVKIRSRFLRRDLYKNFIVRYLYIDCEDTHRIENIFTRSKIIRNNGIIDFSEWRKEFSIERPVVSKDIGEPYKGNKPVCF